MVMLAFAFTCFILHRAGHLAASQGRLKESRVYLLYHWFNSACSLSGRGVQSANACLYPLVLYPDTPSVRRPTEA
jgi:isopentenyldiphosphate isomerase